MVNQYNKEINLNLAFREPANISVFRKQLIRYDIAKFRDFISGLQISVSAEVPPIAIRPDFQANEIGSSTPPNLPNYRFELLIGTTAIFDRRAVTNMYGHYVFDQMISKAAAGTVIPIRFYIYGNNLGGIAEYFNSSFWNRKYAIMFSPLEGYLWDIREHLGASFTDKLAAATVKAMLDSPGEVMDADWTIYSVRSLMIGDLVAEVECNSWPKIAQIIEADGVAKEMINSQTFPHTSIPIACTEAWRK